ncbi:MAG: V-type ATP synthase subunit F [bacterium]
MSKIAALGERDALLCFKALGVEIFPVTIPEEGINKLKTLLTDLQYGIILISESIAKDFSSEINQLRQKTEVIILVIPGYKGSLNTSLMEIKKLIERAVGIDLISKDG